MNVQLAPSWRAAIARSTLVLIAAGVVFAFMWMANGRPTPDRALTQNELAIFHAGPRGLLQLFGEPLVVAAIVWFGRRKLNVRL